MGEKSTGDLLFRKKTQIKLFFRRNIKIALGHENTYTLYITHNNVACKVYFCS